MEFPSFGYLDPECGEGGSPGGGFDGGEEK